MKTLKIEELSKNFGSTEVLKKINLEIDEGNFLVLLGPSGCGKSTLLNIIAGLETINEGNVYIDDYNVSKVEPKDRNIAMVFQSYALYPSMNVRENMIFGLKQAKVSKEKIEEQLEKVSKFLQVDSLLERKPSQLSGGQRQAIALARARNNDEEPTVTFEDAQSAIGTQALKYGREEHYDTVSAFIKSIRGSDPDAGLYWLARMLDAGEDPRFIARRLLVLASEDVGMADSYGLVIAEAAARAVEYVGLPEAQLNLAHAVIYLSVAPKSNNVFKALEAAKQDAQTALGEIPRHLRDSHYSGAKGLGHGNEYKYPHDYPGNVVKQRYRPDRFQDQRYYVHEEDEIFEPEKES